MKTETFELNRDASRLWLGLAGNSAILETLYASRVVVYSISRQTADGNVHIFWHAAVECEAKTDAQQLVVSSFACFGDRMFCGLLQNQVWIIICVFHKLFTFAHMALETHSKTHCVRNLFAANTNAQNLCASRDESIRQHAFGRHSFAATGAMMARGIISSMCVSVCGL